MAGDADDTERVRKQARRGKIVERRQQQAFGQVAAGAEDNEGAWIGLPRLAAHGAIETLMHGNVHDQDSFWPVRIGRCALLPPMRPRPATRLRRLDDVTSLTLRRMATSVSDNKSPRCGRGRKPSTSVQGMVYACAHLSI
jgi:hypothetical protein